tara:strand:- start:46 stop:561 length:516 start_codon:yes stop_codon:yes gene_type:complete
MNMKVLKNMTKYVSPITLPRLPVGTVMSRLTLNGRYEEAMLISVTCADSDSTKSWAGTVMAKNGIEFVSGDTEHRGKTDWMPKEWIYHEDTNAWYGPKLGSVEEEGEIMAEPEDTTPDVIVEVSEPWEGEKYFSWRSRVMKSDSRLKALPDIKDTLSSIWKDKSFDKGIQL